MILLTIGIPTYNRASKLKNLLTVVNNQISKISNPKIELIISNNNSKDRTKEIIEKFKFSDKVLIKLLNQKKNIGPDANVDALFKSSSGLYTWILADDDELMDDAIKQIYDVTDSYDNYKFIFVNYLVSTSGGNINSLYPPNINKEEDSLSLMETIDYANDFISACIFKTSEWNKIEIEPFLNTFWMHLYMAREVLNEGKSYIIGKPLFIGHPRDDYPEGYYGDDLPWHFNVYYNTNRFFFGLKNFKKTSSRNYKSPYYLAYNDVQQILYYKLTRDRDRFNEIVKMIKLFNKFRSFHLINLISIFLLFTPIIIFNSIRKIYKLFLIKQ